MNRREARETAFSLIFEMGYYKEYDTPTQFEIAKEIREFEDDEYLREVVFGVNSKLEEIDKKIEENSIGWKKERISKTSLAIMRLSVYEMCFYNGVPYNVSINEAVELAKKYDSDLAPAFINGVLNAIATKEGLKEE